MYTHARQFPHLKGFTDDEIKSITKRALAKNQLMGALSMIMYIALPLAGAGTAYVLKTATTLTWGPVICIVLVTFFVLVVAWKLTWLNLFEFNLTRKEIERKD